MNFTASQIRRLLAGQDVLTILPMEPQPNWNFPGLVTVDKSGLWKMSPFDEPIPCPYPVGTVVPVGEEWRIANINANIPRAQFWTIQFRDFAVLSHERIQSKQKYLRLISECDTFENGETGIAFGMWREGNTMPDWAVRIHATVTAVTAKRLEEVTEEEAKATGVAATMCDTGGFMPNGEPVDIPCWITSVLNSYIGNPWCWFIVWKVVRG